MTTNEAFEKWNPYGLAVFQQAAWSSWQAATTESNKRIAEFESEVEHWKALANRPVTDNTQLIANMEHEIAELQYKLKIAVDALNVYAKSSQSVPSLAIEALKQIETTS